MSPCFSRGYLTVAFALTALTTAFVATPPHPVAARRGGGSRPDRARPSPGTRASWAPTSAGCRCFNWLLIGYGVPAVAFRSRPALLRMRSDDLAVRLSDALSRAVRRRSSAFFQIHHALNAGDPLARWWATSSRGLLALITHSASHTSLMRLDLARSNPVFHYASLGFAAISVVLIAFGLVFTRTRYITNEARAGSVGVQLAATGLSASGSCGVYVARDSRGIRPDWYVTAAAVLGLLLVFAYVSLEVRHAFHGDAIGASVRATGPKAGR